MMIRRRIRAQQLAAAGALLLAAAIPVHAGQGDAVDLVQRTVKALPTAPFVARIKLTTKAGVRELSLSQKFVEGGRRGYLEVLAPDDLKGIRHLFIEPTDAPAQQFLKLTASRAIARVSNEMRTHPFLGSTFYIADLVEPPIDEYTHTFAGEEDLNGRGCKVVESVAKEPEKAIYSKIRVAIDPKDLLVLRRDFFDQKGEPLKVWKVEKIQQINGYWTPLIQDMRNTQEQVESRLEITEIKYNVELDDAIFTPEHLRR